MTAVGNSLEAGTIPYDEIDKIVEKHKGDASAIIPILQEIQETMHYVPKEGIVYLAEKLEISPAKIYGIVTFYAQFRLQPMGKYTILLCEGTACHVNGGKMIKNALVDELGIEGGETTEDGLFTLEPVACIGCCSLSPVMVVNGETYAMLTPDNARKVIKDYRDKEAAAQN